MATAAKFRIDVALNDLLMNSLERPAPAAAKGLTLPDPVFPQHPEPQHKFEGVRCDSCGQIISHIQDGWVEWLASESNEGKDILSGLQLVHAGVQAQRETYNCRYDADEQFRTNGSIVEGLPLDRFLGPDGLMLLLSLLAGEKLPLAEILELTKRLQIPGYELVRNLSSAVGRPRLVPAILGHECYLQSELQDILRR